MLLLQLLCTLLFSMNFVAPDLAHSQFTPRTHWRQLPIKGRGLFHAYDVQIRKTTLQSCRQSSTLNTGHLIAPDLVPSLSIPRTHWRQLLIKCRGLFHSMHTMCQHKAKTGIGTFRQLAKTGTGTVCSGSSWARYRNVPSAPGSGIGTAVLAAFRYRNSTPGLGGGRPWSPDP